MTIHQKALLSLSRLPRGVRFISMGRINRPISELQAGLRIAGCGFAEVHAVDGTVRGLAPQDLPTLREATLAKNQQAFVIAFTMDQHAALPTQDPRPNLFATLEADEALSASSDHPPRFLPPPELRSRLHALRTHQLNPDDYAHRLAEIDAAAAASPDASARSKITRFRAAAAKYLAATPSNVPEGKLWTTDQTFLREDSTQMPREVLLCPSTEPEMLVLDDAAAAGKTRLLFERVPKEQFTLAL